MNEGCLRGSAPFLLFYEWQSYIFSDELLSWAGVISRGLRGGAPLLKFLPICGGTLHSLNFCTTLAFQSALTLLPTFCIVLLR